DEVLELLKAGKISNGVAAATYLALVQTRRRVNIIAVTEGFTNEQANRIGLKATSSFEEALGWALARHGDQAHIGVVTKGADIMGHLRSQVKGPSSEVRSPRSGSGVFCLLTSDEGRHTWCTIIRKNLLRESQRKLSSSALRS
ncbi:MAG: hypothetical protein ACYTEK_20565, partial [Planctomycetota bacterium]